MLQFLRVFIVILLPIAECGANPLDDCILQNMASVTSDAAAKFVREACLGKISSNIPLDNLWVESTGSIAPDRFTSSNALYIHLENKSQYAITELMVRITTGNGSKWNDYRVTRFGGIYTGSGFVTSLPPDPASYLQINHLVDGLLFVPSSRTSF
jgi:hypothetical protein